VPDPNHDLATLLDDVKTIKAILTNQDAAFPKVWKALYTVAVALAVVGLVQYFVPFYHGRDFDGLVIWLWGPAVVVMFPVVITILLRELNAAGRAILGQSRVRHLLYARWVAPPAILTVLWTAARNPVFGVEGVSLLLVALWQTFLEQVLPDGFRALPPTFLALGIVELAFNLRGPEVVLFNVLLVAGALVVAATLLRLNQKTPTRAA
jgi:hypothetical protein